VAVALGFEIGATIWVTNATVGKGARVGVAVSVGGICVAVGIAAFVWAYWVITIGKAVFCMSVTLKVGLADPHAFKMMTRSMEMQGKAVLFIFSPWLIFLPQSRTLGKILLPDPGD
jgi:hypothetical protein